MEPCANCGEPFDSAFCPACGQKRMKPGVRLAEVIGDFVSSLYNVDAPLPRTFLTFLRGPAKLTRAFLAGKRKAFTPPVRYFLFGVAYYYIMRWVLNWDPVDSAVSAAGGDPSVQTGAMRVNHWMSKNVNLLLPILIVILASFDRVLFMRTQLSWVERLVHYLFAAGTYLLISTTLLPLTVVWPAIQLLNFFIIFGVIIWATIALHHKSAWNVIKALMMTPVSFTLYIVLCSILVALLIGVPLHELVVRPAR